MYNCTKALFVHMCTNNDVIAYLNYSNKLTYLLNVRGDTYIYGIFSTLFYKIFFDGYKQYKYRNKFK
jgi:hypothetical protein